MPVFSRTRPPPPDDITELARQRLAAKNGMPPTGAPTTPPGPFASAAAAATPADHALKSAALDRISGGNAFAGVNRAGQQNFTGGGGFANRGVPSSQAQRGPPPPQTLAPVQAPGSIQTGVGGVPSTPTGDVVSNSGLGQVKPDPAAAPGADVTELARLRLEQKKERDAREADLKASKARALQAAEARAGLAGMGLSGGTSALVGDVSRVQDRGITEDLANLDQQQRDEQFQTIKRQEALDELERSENLDVDGDGKVGGLPKGKYTGDGKPDDFDKENDKPKKPKKDDPTAAGDAAGVANDVAKYFGASSDVVVVVKPGDAPSGDNYMKLPWPGPQFVYLDTTTGQIYVVQA